MENDESKPGVSGRDMEPEKAEVTVNQGKTVRDVPFMEQYYLEEAAVTVTGEQEQPNETQPNETSLHEAEGLPGPNVEKGADVSAESFSGTGEEEAMNEEDLNQVIENLCRSKAQEFRMLGYEQVTGQEVWECVSDKYKKTGIPPLHRIVNDILSLKVTQFMNWMTMSIYKDSAHFR